MPEKKPYIIDEITKKQVFIYPAVGLLVIILSVSLFELPEWLIISLLIGYAVMLQSLIKDKYFSSSWVKPKEDNQPNKNTRADSEQNGRHSE
ncbi:hypothetical protein [Rhizobium rhizogenes]|jgi:hypothetical protein|uniref:hypothetical protein n=1 Tax=Rhizobium rhizogenes TaxID=359 RepID=UPI000646963B|nr:hypothetical protein [Rhizobium rhizogenes]